MRFFCSVVALAVLAACSAPSGTSLVPGSPASPSGSDFVLHAASGAGAASPRAGSITIHSILLNGTVNGETGHATLEGTCKITDVGGFAVGCVVQAKTTKLVVKNLQAGEYTKAMAKGCLAGLSQKVTAVVKPGKDVPFKFKWTGKCG
jgi:hypothetical protein